MTETVMIAILGIIGTLLGTVVGFVCNVTLEKTKTKGDNKLYKSKKQYDLEFDIYRELSKKWFSLIVALTTKYSDDHYKQYNQSKGQSAEFKDYEEIVNHIADVQDCLFEHAPFIPNHIYVKYKELFDLAKEQFWVYMEETKTYLKSNVKQPISNESKERVDRIEELYHSINDDLREYLSSISIVE